jgi:hypothetical protein
VNLWSPLSNILLQYPILMKCFQKSSQSYLKDTMNIHVLKSFPPTAPGSFLVHLADLSTVFSMLGFFDLMVGIYKPRTNVAQLKIWNFTAQFQYSYIVSENSDSFSIFQAFQMKHHANYAPRVLRNIVE